MFPKPQSPAMIPSKFGLLTSLLYLLSAEAAPLDRAASESRGFTSWLKGRAPPTATISPGGTQVTLTGTNANAINNFWGIPYAAPRKCSQPSARSETGVKKLVLIIATGDLRFQHPQDYSYSSSIDATKKGNTCLQLWQPWYQIFAPMDEDCLNLNVQVPEGTAPDANLPVMFWM